MPRSSSARVWHYSDRLLACDLYGLNRLAYPAREQVGREGLPEHDRVRYALVGDGDLRVARHVEHLRLREDGRQMPGQLPAAEVRHHDVGQEQVERPWVPRRHTKRLGAGGPGQRRVALLAEALAR